MPAKPSQPGPAGPVTESPGRIVAHRGASRIAPENTLAAFRLAAAQGARWIEFDVSLLGDGTPVIHHDATLDRCTNARGPLTDISAGDLAGIDAGGWFGPAFAGEPLPTLEATLELIAALGISANLEMKSHDAPPEPLAAAVANALAARPWAAGRILVSSFEIPTLAALRKLMPMQPLAALYDDPPADWSRVLEGLGAASLHIEHLYLTGDILAQAARHGVHVRVYTINEPDRVAPYRAIGLAGVITDHPPLFLDRPDWRDWAAGD